MRLRSFQAFAFAAGGFFFAWATEMMWPGTPVWALLSVGTVLFAAGFFGPYLYKRHFLPWFRREGNRAIVTLIFPTRNAAVTWGILLALILIYPFILLIDKVEKSIACDSYRLTEAIEETLQEANAQHFEHELRTLYPNLRECGFPMPMIGDPNAEKTRNNSKWYQIHIHFLKVLRRNVKNGDYDINQWDKDVTKANQEMIRHKIVGVHDGTRQISQP